MQGSTKLASSLVWLAVSGCSTDRTEAVPPSSTDVRASASVTSSATSSAPAPTTSASGGPAAVPLDLTAPVLARPQRGTYMSGVGTADFGVPQLVWQSKPAQHCRFEGDGRKARCTALPDSAVASGSPTYPVEMLGDKPSLVYHYLMDRLPLESETHQLDGTTLPIPSGHPFLHPDGSISITSKSSFAHSKKPGTTPVLTEYPEHEEPRVLDDEVVSFRVKAPRTIRVRRLESSGALGRETPLGEVTPGHKVELCLAEDGTKALLWSSFSKIEGGAEVGARVRGASGWAMPVAAKVESFAPSSVGCARGEITAASIQKGTIAIARCDQRRCGVQSAEIAATPKAQAAVVGDLVVVVDAPLQEDTGVLSLRDDKRPPRPPSTWSMRLGKLGELERVVRHKLACGAPNKEGTEFAHLMPTAHGVVVVLGTADEPKLCAFFVDSGGRVSPVPPESPTQP